MDYRSDYQSELTILSELEQSENIQLPVYAGFVSGKIINPSQISPVAVQFYSSLKEVRLVIIGPNSKLEFESIQADRIIFRLVDTKNYFAAYSYIIQLMNSTSTQDENESYWRTNMRLSGLSYSELEPYMRTVKLDIDSGKKGMYLSRDFQVPGNTECGVAYATFAPQVDSPLSEYDSDQVYRFAIQREDANKVLDYPGICAIGTMGNTVYPPSIPHNEDILKLNSVIGQAANSAIFDLILVPGTDDAHVIMLRVLELPRESTFISSLLTTLR